MRRIKNNLIMLIFIIIGLIFSCIRKSASVDANKPVVKVLDSLSRSFNNDTLSIAVAKIDSVLSYEENKKYGYYYYKRGYCHTILGNHQKAVEDFMVSKEIGFESKKSMELIEFNNDLLENERKYAPYH